MKKRKERIFDISDVKKNLPLTFSDLAVKVSDKNQKRARLAKFGNYRSGDSLCQAFYKPTSKLKKHD